ncbi:hypothetical protein Q3G72_022413 [Acer saccharum]|nr:hypothetical protein Q3G72_022413 [Acer saccharum]
MKFLGFVLLELVLLVIPVNGGNLVKRLPGYNGDLPFTLETGYVGVGQNKDVQLFYYFVESQKDPLKDPLLLWIAGGPGCSALASFLFASGPLSFDIKDYNGGLPSLVLNPYTWTQGLNIIYLDAPVGTGFSYSKTYQEYNMGDYKFVAHAYHFLVKWFMEHSKFLGNQFYIAGEGYSGNLIPMIVQEIIKGNQVKHMPVLNLKGYMIGNPGTDIHIDFNSRIPFAHRMSLIPDKLFESAKTNCNGDFIAPNRSKKCASDIDSINELINKINTVQIFEPSCISMLPKLNDENMAREYLKDKYRSGFFGSQPNGTQLWCREYNHVFSYIWANDKSVQEALHVHKGTKSPWQYCNDNLNRIYTHDVTSVVDYYRKLSKAKLRVLIYSGDVDMAIPHIGTQQWIMSLNMTLNESWRAWSVDAQIAGYTTKFTKNTDFGLTYATVKGAGHFAAEHKIKECSAMIHRWISYYPL